MDTSHLGSMTALQRLNVLLWLDLSRTRNAVDRSFHVEISASGCRIDQRDGRYARSLCYRPLHGVLTLLLDDEAHAVVNEPDGAGVAHERETAAV